MKPPIFIIGNPRSGTTLLRLVLTCHHDIVVPPECGFAIWWLSRYADWPAPEAQPEGHVERFVRDVMSSKKMETWRLSARGLVRFLHDKRPASYAAAVAGVYEFYAESQGRAVTRWGDKNNFHLHHIPQLHDLFPNARFVHIVRDGRDVACSYKELAAREIGSPHAPRLPSDVRQIAREWAANLRTIRDAFDRIGRDAVTEISFEALVGRTEATVRSLCGFLDEPFDPTMLRYHDRNRSLGLEPVEFLRWKEKTTDPPDRSRVGRFRTELTVEEQQAFSTEAAALLEHHGYPP